MDIYKLTFPNGKIYIGQTKNFEYRMRTHKYTAKDKNICLPIYSAINKYGWENVVKEKLLVCEPTQSDYYEMKLIEIFNCTLDSNLGYNCTLGGNYNIGGVTEETKRKIKERHPWKQWTEERKQKMSLLLKGNKSRTGMTNSEETRRKISVANKGRVVSAEGRLNMGKAKLGKKFSEEAKLNMSKCRIGKKRGSPSEETKQKLRNALLGRKNPITEETKKKISEANRGKKLDKETRKWITREEYELKYGLPPIKNKKGHPKGYKHSQETIKKITESHKGKKFSEEVRKKLSEVHKGHKPSEETKAKMRASQQNRRNKELLEKVA